MEKMRSILLFLTIILIQVGFISTTIDLNQFRQEALAAHNYYRQLHGAQPMVLNSTINTIAQNYADILAANDSFSHSGRSGLGENLWGSGSSNPITYVNGSTPVGSWYNEILNYTYTSPGFSMYTGHFTQVIWNNSVQLGIGIALTNNSQKSKVVANYYPPGNYDGEFPANVFPLLSDSLGGD